MTAQRRTFKPLPGGSGGSGDNGTEGGGGCCCCEYVEYPDTILSDGIETTIQRQLCEQLEKITERQTHGKLTITFPAPELMVLERENDPVTDTYVWDIPESAFSATYLDGTDATSALDTPTGSVIFNHYIAPTSGASEPCGCAKMRLRIEWDADIPEQPSGSGQGSGA